MKESPERANWRTVVKCFLPLPILAIGLAALVVLLGYGTRSLSPTGHLSREEVTALFAAGTREYEDRLPVGQHQTSEWSADRSRTFSESPDLRQLAIAGDLPPVEARIPKNPLVITPPEQIGPYGGTWAQFTTSPGDIAAMTTISYETLLRWDPLLQQLIPNLASSWSIDDGARTFTFHLREGIHWSDGAPFTANDILFWYHHVLLNPDLTPFIPQIYMRGGEVMKVTKSGDYTIHFQFLEPHGLFPQWIANPLMTELITYPAHYFRQFHPDFADPGELRAQAAAEGFSFWHQLFLDKANWQNLDTPTLAAWNLTAPPPARIITFERNPYYWKVDPEGNQLPYIDRLTYEILAPELMNLRFLNGDMGVQHRHVSLQNYALFMENRDSGNYRVNTWISSSGSGVLMPNLNHRDPTMRAIISDRRFRLALSHAINRDEINEAFYAGLGEPLQLSPIASSPLYRTAYAKAHTDFDPAKANRLLDAMGLTERDENGIRLRPDGVPLEITIEMFPLIANVEALQLVADFWTAVGVKTNVRQFAPSLFLTRMPGRLHDIAVGGNSNVNTPLLDHMYFVPIGLGARHALAYVEWFRSDGERGEEPPPAMKEIVNLYHQIERSPDLETQYQLADQILAINAHHLWLIGVVGNLPGLVLVHESFRNVPDTAVIFGNAGVTAPECYAIAPRPID